MKIGCKACIHSNSERRILQTSLKTILVVLGWTSRWSTFGRRDEQSGRANEIQPKMAWSIQSLMPLTLSGCYCHQKENGIRHGDRTVEPGTNLFCISHNILNSSERLSFPFRAVVTSLNFIFQSYLMLRLNQVMTSPDNAIRGHDLIFFVRLLKCGGKFFFPRSEKDFHNQAQ